MNPQYMNPTASYLFEVFIVISSFKTFMILLHALFHVQLQKCSHIIVNW